jgi:ADP-ribose pyrophosphatase YjhB (NUDIX family)
MEKPERYSGVLVKCNNKVLLCKRSPYQSLHGVWSIPAGSVEKGETPREAAVREFFEETNIVIEDEEDLKLIGTANRYARDNKYLKGILYVYLIETDEEIYPDLENANDGGEHTECGYFSLKELPIEDYKDGLFKIIMKIL